VTHLFVLQWHACSSCKCYALALSTEALHSVSLQPADQGSPCCSELFLLLLRYAPESRVNEIRKRCGIKPGKLRSQHKGIRTQGVTRAW
jgi:hypothetical protein